MAIATVDIVKYSQAGLYTGYIYADDNYFYAMNFSFGISNCSVIDKSSLEVLSTKSFRYSSEAHLHGTAYGGKFYFCVNRAVSPRTFVFNWMDSSDWSVGSEERYTAGTYDTSTGNSRMATNGTYVYLALSSEIVRFAANDFSSMIQADYSGAAYKVWFSNNVLYAQIGGNIVELNADLTIAHQASLTGVTFYCAVSDGTYVYAGGAASSKAVIAKFNASNLSLVSYNTYSGMGAIHNIGKCGELVVGVRGSTNEIIIVNTGLVLQRAFTLSGDLVPAGFNLGNIYSSGSYIYITSYKVVGTVYSTIIKMNPRLNITGTSVPTGFTLTTLPLTEDSTSYAAGSDITMSAGSNLTYHSQTSESFTGDDTRTSAEYIIEGIVYPTDELTTISGLVHRYYKGDRSFSLEVTLGGVTTDFALPRMTTEAIPAVPTAPLPVVANFKCVFCGSKFSTVEELIIHYKKVHPDEAYYTAR